MTTRSKILIKDVVCKSTQSKKIIGNRKIMGERVWNCHELLLLEGI
ncbi:hypothetical protein HanRHA438_Chr03g0147421 [Helianthus annuus]|nr:hypothetical protein HanRHA438_Chr03g0147421 [Helianthus annuus]